MRCAGREQVGDRLQEHARRTVGKIAAVGKRVGTVARPVGSSPEAAPTVPTVGFDVLSVARLDGRTSYGARPPVVVVVPLLRSM